jgi:hypothetical protein
VSRAEQLAKLRQESTLTHTAEASVEEIDDVVCKLLDSMLDIDKTEREILMFEALKALRIVRNELHLAVGIDASGARS